MSAGASVVALAFTFGIHVVGVAEEDRVVLTITRSAGVESCPDDATLRERVRRRIGSEPFRDLPRPTSPALDERAKALLEAAGDDDDDTKRDARTTSLRTLHVSLSSVLRRNPSEQLVRARIDLRSPTGAFHRELTGPRDCERLADDLVLAIAIAIDPLLLMRPSQPNADTGSGGDAKPFAAGTPLPPPVNADAAAAAVEDAAARAAGSGVYAWRSGDLPRIVESELPFDPPIPEAAWLRVGVGVSAFASRVPTQSVRSEVSLDYGAFDLDGGVRLDMPSSFEVERDAEATMRVTVAAAHIAACYGVILWRALRLRGCEVNEAGSIIAEGIGGLDDGTSVSHPWVALGGRGAMDLPITRWLFMYFGADALVPLLRPRYVDSADGTLYHQPAPVSLLVGFGLMARLK